MRSSQRTVVEGIVTLAESIVGDIVAVGESKEAGQVPGWGDVNAAQRSGNCWANCGVGCCVEHSLHSLGLQRCEWAEIAAGWRSERTEESGIHLVADGDHIRQNAR